MSLALQSLMPAPRRLPRARPASGLFSFLSIGAMAALAFIVVSSLAVWALPRVESWVVSSVCYAGFVLPVYLLHRRFSFHSEARHRDALPKYVAVQGLAMLLATLFGYLFHGTMGLPSLPAAVLVAGLTASVNFMVLKGWAFSFRKHTVAAVA